MNNTTLNKQLIFSFSKCVRLKSVYSSLRFWLCIDFIIWVLIVPWKKAYSFLNLWGQCLIDSLASLVTQTVNNVPAMRETWAWFLGQEDPLEKDMATHSGILACRIPTDRGAWRATVHGVTKSWTRLSHSAHTQACVWALVRGHQKTQKHLNDVL